MKIRNVFLLVLFVSLFIGCDSDDNCTHDWQWVVTQEGSATEERIETKICSNCNSTDGTRSVAIHREKIIDLTFDTIETTFTVKGTLTLSDLNTLSNKLTTAINAGYTKEFENIFEGLGNKENFEVVFNDTNKVTIIIEDNVSYDTKVDNRITLRININYLLTINSNDLMEKIIVCLMEMREKGY